ncbi:MAG: PilT protein [uncultured bacterium]|nr:MAG: PilT protein [uncultured bacterium]
MRIYIDADILIWHLRGKKEALSFLKSVRTPAHELWIGAMQRAEVVFFMKPHEEKNTLLFLAEFQTQPVDENIVDLASAYFRKWSPSHGTDPNDAILAAMASKTGGRIYCLNTKHYPMPDVSVEKAW